MGKLGEESMKELRSAMDAAGLAPEFAALEQRLAEAEAKLDTANETIAEQRRRLEVLYDGTEGSTPAITRIARLETQLDAANARVAGLEMVVAEHCDLPIREGE